MNIFLNKMKIDMLYILYKIKKFGKCIKNK